jgi:hypothetical protein
MSVIYIQFFHNKINKSVFKLLINRFKLPFFKGVHNTNISVTGRKIFKFKILIKSFKKYRLQSQQINNQKEYRKVMSMYSGGKVKGKKSEEALLSQFGDKRGELSQFRWSHLCQTSRAY